MYVIYNFLLILYWIGLIPVIFYRLLFEKGFYQRIKQSAGFMPEELLKKVEDRKAIWFHAASVGEIVATSPMVKEMKKVDPESVIIVSVVTVTGHTMAHRIIPEADGIIFFPLDLPFLTRRILKLINPSVILLVETELWPNFLRIAESMKIPIVTVNGRIGDRSMKRYQYIRSFTKEMLTSITRFCMQSQIDAEYIQILGAPKEEVIVTGNTKYDQTYAIATEEDMVALELEFGFSHNYPILIAGSTHKGEEELLLGAFKEVLNIYPSARMILAPREIFRGYELQALAEKHGFKALCRTDMKGPVAEEIPIVILNSIGELGRLYSLGDIVFVGGSLVRIGGHNILEPAVHGKPILVGPHMFNFKDIFALLTNRDACRMVKDGKALTEMILHLCAHEEDRKAMSNHCLKLVEENQGASARNIQEVIQLLKRK